MPTPFTSAATLIRQSKDETGGKAYQIGDDLYIHTPIDPPPPSCSPWPDNIIEQQLSEIKFEEFSEKIDKINDETHHAQARQARRLIWECFSNIISSKINTAKVKQHSGKNKFYQFHCKDMAGGKIEFNILAENFSNKSHGEGNIEAIIENGYRYHRDIKWPPYIKSGTMLQALYFLSNEILIMKNEPDNDSLKC